MWDWEYCFAAISGKNSLKLWENLVINLLLIFRLNVHWSKSYKSSVSLFGVKQNKTIFCSPLYFWTEQTINFVFPNEKNTIRYLWEILYKHRHISKVIWLYPSKKHFYCHLFSIIWILEVLTFKFNASLSLSIQIKMLISDLHLAKQVQNRTSVAFLGVGGEEVYWLND